ncbi:permease [Brenneria tiliae]|uniref:Permease n=1 Tax=Brenneria tiliae TaxID=2914984 RepID=A0ABT0MQ35_9GAMM|nr:permease [Brenneria tiliae]MCL2891682.1 permease [Brenneria tiliae]
MIELIYFLIFLSFLMYFFFFRRAELPQVGKVFLMFNIKLLPFVLAIIILTSIIRYYIPQDAIVHYLGSSSHFHTDVFLGSFLGCFFEGPSIIAFVIGAILMQQGASAGAITSFISSFSMIGLIAIPLEIKELGVKFTLTRFFVTFLFSLFFGIAVQFFISM